MNKDTFFVFDIKTANVNLSSVCEIALVEITKYKMHSFWKTVVNPQDIFDINSSLFSRINYDSVRYSPKPKEALETFYEIVGDKPLISFSIRQFNVLNYNNEILFEKKNHNFQIIADEKIANLLENTTITKEFTIEYLANKHNLIYHPNFAIDDARVTAYLVLFALKKSNTKIADWINS